MVVDEYRLKLGMTLMGSTEWECQPEGVLVSLGISCGRTFSWFMFPGFAIFKK